MMNNLDRRSIKYRQRLAILRGLLSVPLIINIILLVPAGLLVFLGESLRELMPIYIINNIILLIIFTLGIILPWDKEKDIA